MDKVSGRGAPPFAGDVEGRQRPEELGLGFASAAARERKKERGRAMRSEEEREMGTSPQRSYPLKQGDKEEVARRHPSGRRKKKGKEKGILQITPWEIGRRRVGKECLL